MLRLSSFSCTHCIRPQWWGCEYFPAHLMMTARVQPPRPVSTPLPMSLPGPDSLPFIKVLSYPLIGLRLLPHSHPPTFFVALHLPGGAVAPPFCCRFVYHHQILIMSNYTWAWHSCTASVLSVWSVASTHMVCLAAHRGAWPWEPFKDGWHA